MNFNKLNYTEFFEYIWESDTMEVVVSTKWMCENEEFIKHYTLELYRLYEFQDVAPVYFKKMVEIFFSNLFFFQPKTHNIKEIQDNYRDI